MKFRLVHPGNPLILLILVLSSSILQGQEVGLSATTDSSRFRIGDRIVLHVHGRTPPNLEAISPAAKDSVGPFEILSAGRSGNEPDWTFELMTIDTGRVFVPPIPFAYRVKGDTTQRQAYTNPVSLTVAGVTVDAQGEIKDIKPPLSAPWKFEDFVPYLIALLVLLIAGMAYYYYRKRRMQRESMQEAVRSAIPPHREALAALRLIEEKKLWQQGKVKQYYSEVTEIIRTFFERRWKIVALELTSDEILQQMKQIPESEKVWKQMQSFFTTADLVKFAKYEPAPAEHESEMQWAYEIVRSMIPPQPTEDEVERKEVVHAG
ncbi:MAG: hypothetical protein WBD36_00075 [Bacteroidota bacterium]